MNELHPSPTARFGNIPSTAIKKGLHRDIGPHSADKEVWCQQCGFRCNLLRDARGLNEFSGDTITSGNVLTNGSFEDWTGSNPDSWTLSGSVSQETSAGFFDSSDDGISSMKIVRSGSDISVSQSPATPSDFQSNKLTFRARVKSTTNGVVRLRVTIDSVNYDSSYNIAQQNFQELAVKIEAPASISSMTCYILADSSDGTAYIDQATLIRSGNPSTASVGSGCPHCGSSNYF